MSERNHSADWQCQDAKTYTPTQNTHPQNARHSDEVARSPDAMQQLEQRHRQSELNNVAAGNTNHTDDNVGKSKGRRCTTQMTTTAAIDSTAPPATW